MLTLVRKPKPLVLCILDGWGVSPNARGNAILAASPHNFNSFWFSYPHTLLATTGRSVGLPEGEVGNSEVGHLNLGAGRIVLQDLLRINMAIDDGSFFNNEALIKALEHANRLNTKIHLMGLVGLGSVHSVNEHLYALLEFLHNRGIAASRVRLHLFTDGRDSPPSSAKSYLGPLVEKLQNENLGSIASVSGRWWAMDRDNRWDRIEKAYRAITGECQKRYQDVLGLVDDSYKAGIEDEFIEPTVIVNESGQPLGAVSRGDAVIFFNYRPDRARQLTRAFVADEFGDLKTSAGELVKTFARGPKLTDLFFVTMTQYDASLPVSAVVFGHKEVAFPLARVFAEANFHQLHIAETEKYAHVTYFFNGGREAVFAGEERILVPSVKVASYDLAFEMSTPEICRQLTGKINSRLYDFIVVNLANADMVAHTGNWEAMVKAIGAVDNYLGLIIKATLSVGGAMVVTADHGNAEELINPVTGKVDTEHNANPAPCIFVVGELRGKGLQLPRGILSDVAPTILALMKIPKPTQMTGRNLLDSFN